MADQDEVIQRFPARVELNLRDVSLQAGTVTLDLSKRDEMMDVIREHAADPTIFDTRDPYIWVARISNSRKDYYSTIMDPQTTLRNYVEDAVDGVAFLDSHDTFQQPCGRSFAAAYVEADDIVNVYAAFYTIPDLKNQRINTTDLIDSIKSGITKDVSVGFKRGEHYEMRCSICGGDMNRWQDCDHFQGIRYEYYDDNDGTWKDRIAIGIIIDARLSEVSAVYDGATPTCMIEKAKFLAERGLIRPKQRTELEQQMRQVLPPPKSTTYLLGGNEEMSTQFARDNKGSDTSVSQSTKEGERQMNGEGGGDAKAQHGIIVSHLDGFTRSMQSLDLVKSDEKPNLDEIAARATNEITRLRAIETQVKEFRTAEIESALAQGVRAQGEKFDKTRYEGLFVHSTLNEIRSFGKEWQEKADVELGTGRRSTETEDDAAGNKDGEGDEGGQRKVEKNEISDRMLLPDNVYAQR